MNKTTQLIEKVAVTFIEAAGAYYLAVSNPQANKAVIAGAIGAGLSAVYNTLRQSNPTIVNPTNPTIPTAPQV